MSFDTFWQAYPRRVARKEALRAWIQVQGERHLQAILAALEWQRKEWSDVRFTPHPATWLRGERWTDEKPVTHTLKLVPDWTEECRLHHGLTCDSRYQHGLLMNKEQAS